MAELKCSVVIPYKDRLRNLRVALTALTEQTMPGAEFEVIIGSLDNSQGFYETCREFAGRLNLTTVMVDEEWNFSRARNLGLRHVTGEVVVLLDADMALPSWALASLYERYFADGQNICVLGQLIGMNNLVDSPEDTGDLPEHRNFREILAELAKTPGVEQDERWHFDCLELPWTIVWTAYVALPGAAVRDHGLLFDESFRGWGGEDQEWGYRVTRAGTPIVRGEDVYALHLPHYRNVSRNLASFDVNKGYFLSKWQTLDVQIYRAFNSWDANRLYQQAVSEVAAATAVAGGGETLGIARGRVDGRDTLVAGLALDGRSRIGPPEQRALFDAGSPVEVLPLIGLTMPFPDHSIEECRLLPPVLALGEQFRKAVWGEARRVARTVVEPVEPAEPAAPAEPV